MNAPCCARSAAHVGGRRRLHHPRAPPSIKATTACRQYAYVAAAAQTCRFERQIPQASAAPASCRQEATSPAAPVLPVCIACSRATDGALRYRPEFPHLEASVPEPFRFLTYTCLSKEPHARATAPEALHQLKVLAAMKPISC